MYSIAVKENVIVGQQTSKTLPAGNIEIDQAMRDTLKALKDQARQDGRNPTINWNAGVPSLIPDDRLFIAIAVNGNDKKVRVGINEPFTVAVTVPSKPNFSGTRLFRWFDRLFEITFVSGTGTKVISSSKSLEYTIAGNEKYSSNSVLVQIVE